MSVWRSLHPNLRVTFPPEQYGFGEGADYFYNEEGKRCQKPSPFKPVKFTEGAAAVVDQRDEFMRKHPGNEANGGSDFWEESEAATKALNVVSMTPTATMPVGGLQDDDIATLKAMERVTKHLPPAGVPGTVNKCLTTIERFKITGISAPALDWPIRRIKARIIEILSVCEDAGIRAERTEDDDGAGNTGGSSADN